MDDHSAELLIELIDAQAITLRKATPPVSDSRGGSLGKFVDLLTNSAETQAHELLVQLKAAENSDRPALGRKLSRCRTRLNVAHMLISDYAADVSRQDMPTGLLCLIDALVQQLLPRQADPLIHLSEKRMYSTLSLNEHAASLLREPDLAADIGVVVFNLPALDPGNVLYAPILAHEVAHTLVSQHNLIGELLAGADLNAVNALFAERLAQASNPDAADWKQRLVHWLQELVCDAVATRLSGPSFLLSSSAFLPATSMTGPLSSHPFPVERLSMCSRQLERLGWSDYLAEHYPTICAWLKELSDNEPPPADPQEAFLREALEILADDIADVAAAHVEIPLQPITYGAISVELVELLSAGIPAARLGSQVPSAWDLVLAGWQAAISSRGDKPASISASAEDKEFNDFLVKALEVARITEIWDES